MVCGVHGQLGVPAVRAAEKAPVPGRGNVTPLPLQMAANPVLDQSLRERLATINLAILKVRIQKLGSICWIISEILNFKFLVAQSNSRRYHPWSVYPSVHLGGFSAL